MKEKYYISTAIAYTSGKPHIGNTYEIVLADAIARFKRLQGYDVYLQTGTDEHGEKIELKAKDAGVTPKEYVDKIIETYKNREEIEKYAHVASLKEVEENEYNLNIPRYVDTFEEDEEAEEDIRKLEAAHHLLITSREGMQYRIRDVRELDKTSQKFLERFL